MSGTDPERLVTESTLVTTRLIQPSDLKPGSKILGKAELEARVTTRKQDIEGEIRNSINTEMEALDKEIDDIEDNQLPVLAAEMAPHTNRLAELNDEKGTHPERVRQIKEERQQLLAEDNKSLANSIKIRLEERWTTRGKKKINSLENVRASSPADHNSPITQLVIDATPPEHKDRPTSTTHEQVSELARFAASFGQTDDSEQNVDHGSDTPSTSEFDQLISKLEFVAQSSRDMNDRERINTLHILRSQVLPHLLVHHALIHGKDSLDEMQSRSDLPPLVARAISPIIGRIKEIDISGYAVDEATLVQAAEVSYEMERMSVEADVKLVQDQIDGLLIQVVSKSEEAVQLKQQLDDPNIITQQAAERLSGQLGFDPEDTNFLLRVYNTERDREIEASRAGIDYSKVDEGLRSLLNLGTGTRESTYSTLRLLNDLVGGFKNSDFNLDVNVGYGPERALSSLRANLLRRFGSFDNQSALQGPNAEAVAYSLTHPNKPDATNRSAPGTTFDTGFLGGITNTASDYLIRESSDTLRGTPGVGDHYYNMFLIGLAQLGVNRNADLLVSTLLQASHHDPSAKRDSWREGFTIARYPDVRSGDKLERRIDPRSLNSNCQKLRIVVEQLRRTLTSSEWATIQNAVRTSLTRSIPDYQNVRLVHTEVMDGDEGPGRNRQTEKSWDSDIRKLFGIDDEDSHW